MTKQKRNKAPRGVRNDAPDTKQDPAKMGTVQGIAQAAALLKRPVAIVKWAKAHACPAFRHSRVHVGELHSWLEAHADEIEAATAGQTIEGAKLRIAMETARKLTMLNDERAGALVEKAWVLSRHQIAAAKIASMRAKSEAEHPVKFAALADDVAGCRSVLRGIWDEIAAALQNEMGEAFND